MKIGLLSDTHGFVDEKIFHYFAACDEIWHAGDIGGITAASRLESFKPLRAVFGNIDDRTVRERFPEDQQFACGGLRVLITHIAGVPPRYTPRVRQLLASKPDMLICGHSHLLQVKKDPVNNLLFINPGAAGNQGFHHMRTLLRFEIGGSQVKNMEVIELGKRGALGNNTA